jgi:hypothetical protein
MSWIIWNTTRFCPMVPQKVAGRNGKCWITDELTIYMPSKVSPFLKEEFKSIIMCSIESSENPTIPITFRDAEQMQQFLTYLD